MKLLVAFKVCPDLDLLQEDDFVVREEMGVDTHFLPNILNCYDESSLELALRFRDQAREAGKETELSAMTLGEDHTQLYLKTLQALGYDHPVRVCAQEELLRDRPELVARTIAAYARQTGQQVLLLGREAPLGNHGVTAQMAAALLGYPLISSVTDVKPGEGESIVVRTLERGREMELTVSVPCVLAVGNAVVSKLRIPSLRMRMKWKNIPCEQYELTQGQSYEYPLPIKLKVPDRKRSGYLSPERGEAAVDDVFRRSLEERLEML